MGRLKLVLRAQPYPQFLKWYKTKVLYIIMNNLYFCDLVTRLTICSLCILTICYFSYFPFWFSGPDLSSDFQLLIFAYFLLLYKIIIFQFLPSTVTSRRTFVHGSRIEQMTLIGREIAALQDHQAQDLTGIIQPVHIRYLEQYK